jgi:hypothetical protein
MPRDGAIILADLIGKLDAPHESGPSKAWLKIKSNDDSNRDGAIIFADLIGKLDVLSAVGDNCGREGL